MFNVKRKRAFTLIELLVVITIISLLAAILFPVFARARENARRASCMSNMKQMGLGAMMYTQDYDGGYPLHAYYSSGGNPNVPAPGPEWPAARFKITHSYTDECPATTGGCMSFMDMLFPYTKSSQIFQCPSQKITTTESYGYNAAIGDTSNASVYNYYGVSNGPPHSPIKQAAIQRPAEIILFMEAYWGYAYHLSAKGFRENAIRPEREQWFVPHMKGGNIVYTDGHVKWQSLSTLVGAIGTNGSSACTNMKNPQVDRAFCSKAWNPYIP